MNGFGSVVGGSTRRSPAAECATGAAVRSRSRAGIAVGRGDATAVVAGLARFHNRVPD
jgi:hypothetical protein